jgi:hypothetical protein
MQNTGSKAASPQRMGAVAEARDFHASKGPGDGVKTVCRCDRSCELAFTVPRAIRTCSRRKPIVSTETVVDFTQVGYLTLSYSTRSPTPLITSSRLTANACSRCSMACWSSPQFARIIPRFSNTSACMCGTVTCLVASRSSCRGPCV